MPWTTEQYHAHLARQAAASGISNPPDGSSSDVVEREIQDGIAAECKRRGWYVVRSRMDRATTNGVGTPDLIVFGDRGRVWPIEVKRPGRKCTTEQLAVAAWLRKLRHWWHVVESLDQFLWVVRENK